MHPIIISAIIMLLLDSAFIYGSSNIFSSQIIAVQRSPIQLNIASAIACYFFLIFGLYYFILRERKSIFTAFLLGVVIYGVYETTSMALLKNWKLTTVLMDTTWGGVLFATTTYLTYFLSSKM